MCSATLPEHKSMCGRHKQGLCFLTLHVKQAGREGVCSVIRLPHTPQWKSAPQSGGRNVLTPQTAPEDSLNRTNVSAGIIH